MENANNFGSSKSKSKVLYTTKLHWIANIIPILLMALGVLSLPITILAIFKGSGGIVMIISFGLTFLFIKGLYSYLLNKSLKISLTSKHLTLSKGVFNKTVNDIHLAKYEGLQVTQSLLGEKLGYGTLFISTGGVAQHYQIQNPMQLREKIMNR